MAEYMIGVTCMCMLVSLASFVSCTDTKRGATKFALGVILLASLVVPVKGIVEGAVLPLFDIKDTEYKDSSAFSEFTEEYFCEGVRLAVADEFSLDAHDVEVITVGFSVEDMRAEVIKIKLLRAAAGADYRAVREYIEKNDLGKCEVEISFDG